MTRFVKFTLFSNKTRSTRLQKTIIKKLYRKRKLKLSDCRVISYFLFCCCCWCCFCIVKFNLEPTMWLYLSETLLNSRKEMICPNNSLRRLWVLQSFNGNYSTLDSHTHTVISLAFAYSPSSRWLRKPRQGLKCENQEFPEIIGNSLAGDS